MKINMEFWTSELQTILKALDFLEYKDLQDLRDSSYWSDYDYTKEEIQDTRMVATKIRDEIKDIIFSKSKEEEQ